MNRFAKILPFFLLLAKSSYAQTDVQALQNALQNKQLWLRNYSADRTVRYEWVSGSLVDQPSKLHTLGVFTLRSINYKRDKLIFEGDRATLVRDVKQDRVFLATRCPMTLEVNLQNAGPDVVIPQIQEKLFFPNRQDAESSLPEPYAHELPLDVSKSQVPKRPQKILLNGQWLDVESSRVTPPKLISAAEARMTDEAHRKEAHGDIWLVFVVSDKGLVSGIWSTPFASGLEEEVVDSVQRYVFKPAQYENKSVGVLLQIAVNIQSFR